jgi:DNA-binding transcriptional MerR regulator
MDFLTSRDVAAFFQVSVRTVESWRTKGGGPKFFRVEGQVRYRLEDLEAYVADREVSA